MAKSERRHFTEEFRHEAVRLMQTSGRTVDQVADDLGLGRSMLNWWRKKLLEAGLLAGPHADPAKEPARLRRGKKRLRQERGLFKKATVFFAKGEEDQKIVQ